MAMQVYPAFRQLGNQRIETSILVPKIYIGSLIGKGGKNIQAIRIQSGANVHVQNDADTPAAAMERVVSIVGLPQQVQAAQFLIQQRVQYSAQSGPQSLGQGAANGRNSGRSRAGTAGSVTRQIQVPNESVGRIIGKRGATISHIRQVTFARIKIEDEAYAQNPGFRLVTLQGTPQQVMTAQYMICEKCQNDKDYSSISDTGAIHAPRPGDPAQPSHDMLIQYQQHMLQYQRMLGFYGQRHMKSDSVNCLEPGGDCKSRVGGGDV